MAEKNLYTVIVADDEDELREAVCTMIPWEALGFHLVGSASNGLDALELVEQLEPDLLLTDIRMPFITGIELARQVREIRPAMHIAFLSGYDDFEYAKQAIQYNIISYMLKPLTMDGLAAELKSIHERIDHQYASLRRSGIVQEDRASFLIPLVLEHCDNTSDAVEAALRTSAAACGLLRGTDDRSQLVVLTAQPDDNSENAAGFVRMVDQLANKYLRHYAFFCNDHVVAVLFGNPSDFDEYLHILADEICQLTERALGQHCVVGVSRAAARFCELNAGYRQSMEALAADKHPNLYVETTSPYLCLDTDSPIGAYGKMLPPIREPESRKALWDGIRSGLIDTIGTDNTVLTAGEKQVSSGMREAGAGYPTLGTHLVSVLDEGIYRQELPIEKLVPLMTMNPARIFGVYPRKGTILPGSDADLVLVDLRAARTVDPRQLLSRSDFSLFQGRTLRGWPVATIKGGHIAAWNGQLTDDLQRGQVLEH